MKNKYVYLVYCNPEHPLVYEVYSAKKDAVKYAKWLVQSREDRAKEMGHEFGFYHQFENDTHKENDFDKREKTIYSACLRINDDKPFSDNACLIKVVRRPVRKSFL